MKDTEDRQDMAEPPAEPTAEAVHAHGVISEIIARQEAEIRQLREELARLNPPGPARHLVSELEWERDQLSQALRALMPFVLRKYFPPCANPAYKAAVERAIELTGITKEQAVEPLNPEPACAEPSAGKPLNPP